MFARTSLCAVLALTAPAFAADYGVPSYGTTFDAFSACATSGVCVATNKVDYENSYINALEQFNLLPPGTKVNGVTANALTSSGLVKSSDFIKSSPAVISLQQQIDALTAQIQQGNGSQQRIDAAFQQIQQIQNAALQMQHTITQTQRGIAAVSAMASTSMPSMPGRTTWAVNGALFQSEIGGGFSFAHRLNASIPMAVTAGYGNGGGSAHVGRVGLMGEF